MKYIISIIVDIILLVFVYKEAGFFTMVYLAGLTVGFYAMCKGLSKVEKILRKLP